MFVMSRVLEDTAMLMERDPIVMDMMAIQKAYPNCSRKALVWSLDMACVPEDMRNRMAKMDSLTG